MTLSLLLVSLAAGCGQKSTLKRVEISGNVTYNGESVKDGQISFVPDVDVKAPPTSTLIKDGKYSVGGDFGIAAGTYRVEIVSFKLAANQDRKIGGDLDAIPEPGGFKDQVLPDKFNKKSTLDKLVVKTDAERVKQDYALKD